MCSPIRFNSIQIDPDSTSQIRIEPKDRDLDNVLMIF